MAQAFGVPAFPVDTHPQTCTSMGLSDGSKVEKTEKDLKRIFPKDKWNTLHLQIIFLAGENIVLHAFTTIDTCLICSWSGNKENEKRRTS